jgi:hypothetical protein
MDMLIGCEKKENYKFGEGKIFQFNRSGDHEIVTAIHLT